jgi:hypothetical protein
MYSVIFRHDQVAVELGQSHGVRKLARFDVLEPGRPRDRAVALPEPDVALNEIAEKLPQRLRVLLEK